MQSLSLQILAAPLAVCRLAANDPLPTWALSGDFLSITRTLDELSIVCPEAQAPPGVTVERGWRGLKVSGPLDFALVGILARLSGALAAAGISLFAISTYDTDYLLVRQADLPGAVQALRAAGCVVN